MWGCLFFLAAVAAVAQGAGAGAARLVCYVEGSRAADLRECTHLVYAGDARGDKLDSLLKEYRKINPRVKIVLRVAEVDKDLRTLFKSKHVQGLELHDAHKTLNKTKVLETVEAARAAITSSGGGPLFISLPAHPELLAKYYDLRALMKKVDLMMVETHHLGAVKKMTYHPSRLSGLWDMMNTDSVVDLVVGLGVPAHKVVITLPATAQQFTLQNETLSTPGSPALEDYPKEIGQDELCRQLQKGRWTLERDQDLSAPYAFKDKTWISFEDASSVDVKGKYARVRGLAGLALYRSERDVENPCGPTLKASLAKVLNQQSRAPRAAVLRSLEHEILSAPQHGRALDALQVSPYRITQIVDSDGVIHSIREDTRTEFSCSRQGYFVHPRSCARFYRCVKFDQLSPEYTVFEFDCPAGLAFDSRYEVCVWPGSLPDSQACPGSSEIAPVPKTRFICPEHEGYYADPENCRWFFACLDHGKAPLTAYEFRCPFGLGFDAEKLKCDWPWLVPACGNIARYEAEVHGYSAAKLTGAAGFHGQTADSVNIAAHQSLVSGASLNNLVGIQGGFLTHEDALDTNFITSQELANGAGEYSQNIQAGLTQNLNNLQGSQGSYNRDLSQGSGLTYQVEAANSQRGHIGLVQPKQYNNEEKYTSGSLILDEYRLPTKKKGTHGKNALNGNAQASVTPGSVSQSVYQTNSFGQGVSEADSTGYTGSYTLSNAGQTVESNNGYSTSSFSGNLGQKVYQGSDYDADNSGAYVHDPSGDSAEPYNHEGSPVVPYVHDGNIYKDSSNYYDYNRYKGASQSDYEGKYVDNSGQYVQDNSGAYVDSSVGYKTSSGAYVDFANKYKDNSGIYVDSFNGNKGDFGAYIGSSDKYKTTSSGTNVDSSNGYKATSAGVYTDSSAGYNGYRADNSGAYIADYSGSYNQDNSGQYEAGVYRVDGHIGNGAAKSTSSVSQSNSQANAGNYISDSKAYTGGSHTLTAGAINVGLVGKTTLVDAGYTDQGRNQGQTGYTQGVSHQTLHPGHVSIVSYPAVSINHVGTDENNLDGYGYVTTPTSSGVPTTATPFAVTTALPAVTTYKTTFVPEAPKSTIKQIFGYAQPPVTFVQPTVVAVKQQYVTPKVQVADYNQGLTYQFENKDYSAGRYNDQTSTNYNRQSSGQSEVKVASSGYDYSKPSVKFEDGISYTTSAPSVTVSTYKPHGFAQSQQTLHKVESVGFHYSTPSPVPVSEETIKKAYAYTTGPSVTTFEQSSVPTYTPQVFSHQTIHKVEASNVQLPSVDFGSTGYSSGVTYEAPKTAIEYSTVVPALAVQPTYQPQVFSQETLHKVDANKVNTYSQDSSSGYNYEKPAVKFEEGPKSIFTYTTPAPTVVQYLTPSPAVVSTYRPQAYSHQTLHKFNSNLLGTVSSTPLPVVQYEYQSTPVTVHQNPFLKFTQPKVTPVTYVQHTYEPQTYSQQTIQKVENNKSYLSDDAAYEQPQRVIQYTTPQPTTPVQPIVSTYRPQIYSQQTLHKVDANQVNTYSEAESGYQYSKPADRFEEAPKTVFTYTTQVPSVVSTKKPHAYSQQTIHKIEAESGYEYSKPSIKFEEAPKTVYTYSTVSPAVVSTNKPHAYSQQTIHKVEAGKGYDYSKQEVRFEDAPKTVFTYSTPAPALVSTYKPQVYSQQTVHRVNLAYKTPDVSNYDNPFIKYTQKVTPVTYVQPTATVYTQTYQPIVEQQYVNHDQSGRYQESSQQSYQQNLQLNQDSYSYSQPEIQRNFETGRKAYSDASVVSHQTVHFGNVQRESDSGNKAVFVSTTPASLTYEEHYSDYVAPKKVESYRAPEYIAPKAEYQQSYSAVSSTTPIIHQSYVQTQDQYDVKPLEYSQQYETVQKTVPVQQVSFSTSHITEPKSVESYHISSFPRTKATTTYQQATYDNPEIQVGFKTEEYLPPAVSTVTPVVTSTYRPRTYSTTTREYLPPTIATPSTTRQYLPPAESEYNALEYSPPSTTVRSRVKSTTPNYKYTVSTDSYKASEYLPPSEEQGVNVVNFESFGFDKTEASAAPKIRYNPYQEIAQEVTGKPVYRKQNIVVETAKSNLLGFGTVGPDAGLVSPISYTTTAPVVSSTYRPVTKSSTQAPTYPTYVKSTPIYQAAEYLPPSDDFELNIEGYGVKSTQQTSKVHYQENIAASKTAPIQRKQNIVVQTAKANQLGFGTVGSDAGLVSQVTYTASTPVVVSSSESYTDSPKRLTSTYAPLEQGLFEVSPSPAPRRRVKPKVAVVTKINDFNPLLVRKLGAVCSCQSPVLVLKGKRPNVPQPQDFDDYTNEYDDSSRGDINDEVWAQKSSRIQTPTVTTTPIVTSTFNPIIVPEDSYYQDYQEPSNYDAAISAENAQVVVSSTPAVTSTQRVVRIRPRVKAVTVAPTYETVLLNKQVVQSASDSANYEAAVSEIDSQSFDRYGPGGWRSRDETLQGSVDCKRAGLFRHPKQCNKFYACRWDCTKQRFTLHVFNCPVQLSFDPSIGACNWPSQGPACQGDTLLTNAL